MQVKHDAFSDYPEKEEEKYSICSKCEARMAGEGYHGPACQCEKPDFVLLAPSEMQKFFAERRKKIEDKDKEGEGRADTSRK